MIMAIRLAQARHHHDHVILSMHAVNRIP